MEIPANIEMVGQKIGTFFQGQPGRLRHVKMRTPV